MDNALIDEMLMLLLGGCINVLGRPWHKYSLPFLMSLVIPWMIVLTFGSKKTFS